MILDGRNFVKVGTCFFSKSPGFQSISVGLKKAWQLGKSLKKPTGIAAHSHQIVAVYRRNASQPGALKAMINFYRGWRYGYLERERKWRNGLFEPITTPTLMIWGEEDDFLEKNLTANTQNYVRDLQIRFLSGASHWVQQECDDVNELIQASLPAQSKQ